MVRKTYMKPATKKHASMDVVQGSGLYYTTLYKSKLYYTTLYYTSLYYTTLYSYH